MQNIPLEPRMKFKPGDAVSGFYQFKGPHSIINFDEETILCGIVTKLDDESLITEITIFDTDDLAKANKSKEDEVWVPGDRFDCEYTGEDIVISGYGIGIYPSYKIYFKEEGAVKEVNFYILIVNRADGKDSMPRAKGID